MEIYRRDSSDSKRTLSNASSESVKSEDENTFKTKIIEIFLKLLPFNTNKSVKTKENR